MKKRLIKRIGAAFLALVLCMTGSMILPADNMETVQAAELLEADSGMGKITITHEHTDSCKHLHNPACYMKCNNICTDWWDPTGKFVTGAGCHVCGFHASYSDWYGKKCPGNILTCKVQYGCNMTEDTILNVITYPIDISVIEEVDAHLQIGTMQPLEGCQWQIHNGTDWESLTDSDKYTGTGTEDMTVVSPVQEDTGKVFRCIVQNGGKTYETEPAELKVMKKGYSKIIASYYKQAEAGAKINIENVLVSLMYDNGTADFASGWSNLYFVVTAEDGSETETKEVPVKLGDNTYRVRLKDENPEPILDESGQPVLDEEGQPTYNDCTKETTFQSQGVDVQPPSFEMVTLSDYELMNEDTEVKPIDITVTMSATDNYNKPEEILYAFKPKEETAEDSDYTGEKEYHLSISANTVYTAYAKDSAGNVTVQDVNLIVADTEDPVITSKALIFKEADGWVTKNIIEVEATDNYKPELMTYRFTLPTTMKESEKTSESAFGQWISEKSITVSANGIYGIEVKDSVGNITKAQINVTNIDGTAPEITDVKITKL